MALIEAVGVTFTYPGERRAALDGVSVAVEPGERVAVLGPSGSGKSTLLRALTGLVPHFHGGTFAGRVVVAGHDTRTTAPAELAGVVASAFQDPEDQVVMTTVANEVAFGLENVGVAPAEIWARVDRALARVGGSHLSARRIAELSSGELQRVCVASALALEPRVLVLDEPTSQLDGAGAEQFLDAVASADCAVVLSEQRIDRALDRADRVWYVEDGRVLLDASREAAESWLARHRPAYAGTEFDGALALDETDPATSDAVVKMDNTCFSFGRTNVLTGARLEVRRGEIVVLEGPNGSGKTTLAKIAAGLLEPAGGSVARAGRAAYLSQDPGRYVVGETALVEAALGVGTDRRRAADALADVGLAWAADKHPRDLSSGERERLGLASVLATDADLVVLDEPTRGIDPERKTELAELLVRYARRGRGVLVVTHDRTFPAHRRVELERGSTVERVAVGA